MADYKVIDAEQLDSDLTTVADAIRLKGGTTEPLVFPSGMVDAIVNIQSGDEENLADAIIAGTVTEISSNVENVRQHAFYKWHNLSSVNLPSLTIVENGTFEGCNSLTTINLPSVTSMRDRAFYGCSSLTAIDFPHLTSIGANTFYNCNKVITINLPSLISAGTNAFDNCAKLTTVNLPIATSMGYSSFNNCGSLTTVNLPSVTSIETSMFNSCIKLTTVNLPSATSIAGSVFYGCIKLTTVNLPSATSIASSVFYGCRSLTKILLRSEVLCTLASTNSFYNCYHFHGTVNSTYNPNGLKDGYIYVPRALIEDYKVATNWSTFATQFRALEDYTVDGTITGELDESKI